MLWWTVRIRTVPGSALAKMPVTRAVSEAVRVPVVASGGCGSVAHMQEVLTGGAASAALAASIFHFGEIRIPEAKAELCRAGVEVRP